MYTLFVDSSSLSSSGPSRISEHIPCPLHMLSGLPSSDTGQGNSHATPVQPASQTHCAESLVHIPWELHTVSMLSLPSLFQPGQTSSHCLPRYGVFSRVVSGTVASVPPLSSAPTTVFSPVIGDVTTSSRAMSQEHCPVVVQTPRPPQASSTGSRTIFLSNQAPVASGSSASQSEYILH